MASPDGPSRAGDRLRPAEMTERNRRGGWSTAAIDSAYRCSGCSSLGLREQGYLAHRALGRPTQMAAVATKELGARGQPPDERQHLDLGVLVGVKRRGRAVCQWRWVGQAVAGH